MTNTAIDLRAARVEYRAADTALTALNSAAEASTVAKYGPAPGRRDREARRAWTRHNETERSNLGWFDAFTHKTDASARLLAAYRAYMADHAKSTAQSAEWADMDAQWETLCVRKHRQMIYLALAVSV